MAGCLQALPFNWVFSRQGTSTALASHGHIGRSLDSPDNHGKPVQVVGARSDSCYDHAMCGQSHEDGCASWSTGEKTLSLCDDDGHQGDLYRPDVLETIEQTLDAVDPQLRELSLDIHDHPEIMFQEHHAHDILSTFVEKHGFEVTRHYLGMETAWRAVFVHGKGGRVLGVNSEMDALPGIGHACGHNLIAVSGVGVALAVKAAMEKHDIQGKIILLGTPAEEGGGGKCIMLERGAYKEMDVCVMCHPTPGAPKTATVGSCLAMQPLEIEYFGHTSHAAMAPWEGTNALDAAFLAYSSISVLRQQMKPTHRVHGVIKGPELAANVIPDYVRMLWYVRAPTRDEVIELRERVEACFNAGAMATGCRSKLTKQHANFDLRQNDVLGHTFAVTMKQRYGFDTDIGQAAGASTDFGNVTYELPSLHPTFAIPTEPNGANHTPAFTASSRTPEAHAAMMVTTKALALTGLRVLDDGEFTQQVKQSYQDSWANQQKS